MSSMEIWEDVKTMLYERFVTPAFLFALCVLFVIEIVILTMDIDVQWQFLLITAIIMAATSPVASNSLIFFQGGISEHADTTWQIFVLGLSTIFTGVFAKTLYDSSRLGAAYGIMGCFTAATWVLPYIMVGIIMFNIRQKGFTSLSNAIQVRYGNLAFIIFFSIISWRLWNDLWVNAIIIANFFGDTHSASWWIAAIAILVIPVIYLLLGGLRASLLLSTFQGFVCLIVLLVVITKTVIEADDLCDTIGGDCNLMTHKNPRGTDEHDMITMYNGLDLFIVGLLQGCFSYGFIIPGLTDRAFLGEPRLMRLAFIIAGIIAFLFVFSFGLLGIYGNLTWNSGITIDDDDGENELGARFGIPENVADLIGVEFYSFVNLLMITTCLASLDSSLAAVSKLVGAEIWGFFQTNRPLTAGETQETNALIGRIVIVVFSFIASLTLLADPIDLDPFSTSAVLGNPESLLNAADATADGISMIYPSTVSTLPITTGTMFIGLGPPLMFLTWLKGYRPLCFHIPFFISFSLGLVYRLNFEEEGWVTISKLSIGKGENAVLLGINVLSFCLSMLAFFFFSFGENRIGYDLMSNEATWNTDNVLRVSESFRMKKRNSKKEPTVDVEIAEKSNEDEKQNNRSTKRLKSKKSKKSKRNKNNNDDEDDEAVREKERMGLL